MAPATILVVDDDEALRALLCLILRRAGYLVLEAASGNEALQLAEIHAPDLVVCDVVMPGLSGPETVRRLVVLRPGLRTLFISGYDAADVRRQHGVASEGAAFMQKPLHPAAFAERVGELLRTSVTPPLP
jgi:two-component system, cell cycle sensor histidine kinase and response regulator CckA